MKLDIPYNYYLKRDKSFKLSSVQEFQRQNPHWLQMTMETSLWIVSILYNGFISTADIICYYLLTKDLYENQNNLNIAAAFCPHHM